MSALSPFGSVHTSVNYANAVTPDSLLLICSTRLRSIDDQIQTQFKKQEQYREVTAGVNSLQQDVAHWAATFGIGCEGKPDPNLVQHHLGEVDKLLQETPETSPAHRGLTAYRNDFAALAKERKDVLSQAQCKDFADRLGSISKELGSSAELDMIGLNSQMSQRQTALQMITNMISSLGESSKAIASKIG